MYMEKNSFVFKKSRCRSYLLLTHQHIKPDEAEHYEKESLLRSKWSSLHAYYIEKAARFIKQEKSYSTKDISKTVLESGMSTTTKDHITVTSARHRATAPIPDYVLARVGVTEDTEAPEVPMKPVSRDVKGSLLESRAEYLKKRSLLKPEDKFKYVECTNWVYGWRLGESELKLSRPAHGKVNHLMRDLHSRVGPQPDPEHYTRNAPDKMQSLFITL